MSLKENLIMLEIERQMVVDREKKKLEQLKPVDGMGWLITFEKVEIAELQLDQARRRSGS